MRTRELGRISIVVGDRVGVVGDVSDREGALVRIARPAERSTVLRRTIDGSDPYKHIVTANAGLLLIACAVADPELHTGFVERVLVTAYTGGVRPVLCLTKSDLADPQESAGEFSALGVGVVVYGINDDLASLLKLINAPGRVTALAGHSGVGKSTLVNRIVSEASRETGGVSSVGKGRHTSTQSVASMLPSESAGDATSRTIDTPGIHPSGPAHVTPGTLLAAFLDIQAAINGCPRGYTHLGPPADPECAPDKLEGVQYRRMMAVCRLFSAIDDNEDQELDIRRDQPR